MSLSIFLLLLVSFPLFTIHALPAPIGFHINCGASNETTEASIKWIMDDGFISVGNMTTLDTQGLIPILASLRFFPEETARKYCYTIPVIKGGKYLVRTTYYYGGFDGGKEPPVFDQIIEGSKWSTVNTSENYSKGLTSYYEIIVAAGGKQLSVCLARNEQTKSSPFISALELEYLEDSMYNSTDFTKYALSTVARHSFGYNGKTVSFPDDPFNRYWQPFRDNDYPSVSCHSNVSSSEFWNLPPVRVIDSALTTSRGKTLHVQWPPMALPTTNYYISLYFQDNRTPSPYSWRVLDVSINGKNFYKSLNVSTTGVTVYGTRWPLSGQTEITLTPQAGSPVGPVINAGEIFQLLPLGGKTVTRDVNAMEEVSRSLNNPPADWSGDPCLPRNRSWTGVTCSQGSHVRVVSLNLTSFGLSGSLSPKIANLTALSNIWLGGNKLSGSIPDLSHLTVLSSLHLEDNKFSGKIPESLGQLNNLRELYLQNNNLEGDVPDDLKKRSGIIIQ
ncbi:putative LRR receptor-like serine/threonine-protein kinase At1g51810 isoform X2 [Tasmannia lanceolata]